MPLFMLEPIDPKEDTVSKHREVVAPGSKEQGLVPAGLQVMEKPA